MFTGIIEEIGEIKSFTHNSNGATIVVKCKDVFDVRQAGRVANQRPDLMFRFVIFHSHSLRPKTFLLVF